MVKSKKILIYLTKLEDSGGIESHIFEFLEAFKNTDVKIHLVVPDMRMKPDNLNRLKKMCETLWYNQSGSKWMNKLWFLRACMRMYPHTIDAFYSNGQGESFLFFSKFVRYKKWVHHHHTSGDALDRAKWGPKYIQVMLKADHLIACSTKNAQEIQEVLKRDVISIPCYSRKIAVLSPKDNNEVVKFGYYGRLIPEKGIDTIFKLSEDPDLEKIEFHIWGAGWAYDEKSFEPYDKVFYHGKFKSKEELTQIINSIDAYLLISTHPEGLPISLLEVMSAGIPWLATNVGGIPDIACDPVSTRLLPVNADYQYIKESIASMAADIRMHVIHADNQIRLYNEKFDSRALTIQWRNILNV